MISLYKEANLMKIMREKKLNQIWH